MNGNFLLLANEIWIKGFGVKATLYTLDIDAAVVRMELGPGLAITHFIKQENVSSIKKLAHFNCGIRIAKCGM